MIIGVSMVRDEADVIGYTLAHLLAEGVDRVIVADNLSTDDTPEILRGFGERVTVVDDPDPAYLQADKMTRLARLASDEGADWVVPFDADELWCGVGGRTLAQCLTRCDADIVSVPFYDHIPQRTDDPDEPNPFLRLEWRRDHAQRMPKVAFRAHPDARLHMGNHDVHRPGRREFGALTGRHVQWRTPVQMARKVRTGKAAYEASDLHEMHGSHWRRLGGLDDDGIADEWSALLDSTGLVRDPAPYRG